MELKRPLLFWQMGVNAEVNFIRMAGGLYHMTAQTAEAMGEKMIIWRRETDA